MLSRKLDSFLDSFYDSERGKALLLTGARQVGKTIEFTFVETPDAKDIFHWSPKCPANTVAFVCLHNGATCRS